MNAPFTAAAATLVVIPTLNEERHIGPLLDQLLREADATPMTIVVADGGSTDRTRAVVEAVAARDPRVALVDNPRRIQSAGINRAVDLYGQGAKTLIRIDAHSAYPPDYCAQLLRAAEASGADSVVVGMRTVGFTPFQKAAAAAQNSPLGAGNSAHRVGAAAGDVDHGHHALMRMDAFRAVGGYDETFTHNEDAELDLRLAQAGRRIFMTDTVAPTYYPRETARALFRQYRAYGRGRVRTLKKHRVRPKLRQLVPALVLPAALAAPVALLAAVLLHPVLALLALPALLWAAASLLYGALLAVRARDPHLLASGPAAMVMHLAWSLGFWEGLVRSTR